MIDGRFLMAAIPMRDHAADTIALVESIVADRETDLVLVFDNDSREPSSQNWLKQASRLYGRPVVEVRRRSGNGVIYRLWNEAWRDGLHHWRTTGQLVDLAILNNDITILPGTLGALSRALRAAPPEIWATYPDYTRPCSEGLSPTGEVVPTLGTWRVGGMAGFAFMLKAEIIDTDGMPFIDEQFEWLCGDGDLVQEMHARGATPGRVLGCPIDHRLRSTSTDGRNGWTKAAGARDVIRRRAKWG